MAINIASSPIIVNRVKNLTKDQLKAFMSTKLSTEEQTKLRSANLSELVVAAAKLLEWPNNSQPNFSDRIIQQRMLLQAVSKELADQPSLTLSLQASSLQSSPLQTPTTAGPATVSTPVGFCHTPVVCV